MRRLILLFCRILLFPVWIAAQEGNPYYTKQWSIALSQTPVGGYYQLTTFMPTRYLLFIRDRNASVRIGSQEYLAATTQDGVDVLVLEEMVSEQPFRRSVGRHQVIFNCPYMLCRTPACNRSDSSQVWQVDPGEAFEMINFEEEPLINLRGIRVASDTLDTLAGYMSVDELHDLDRQGVITRTDLPLPRYRIQRIELGSIGTGCSQVKPAGYEQPAGEQAELEQLALQSFGFGRLKSGGGNLLYEKPLGKKRQQISFLVYQVQDLQVQNHFKMIAAVTYLCRERDGGEAPVRIERVRIRNLKDEKDYLLEFEKYKSPDILLNYLYSPYLFSVNTYQQYIDLIRRLGETFGDRELGGYFLSEFNRSCRSVDRGRPEVREYSYRE